MEAYIPFTSRVVVLPANNIDTDQIIPARFLKITDKLDLGKNAFSNWRYNPDGSPKADFPLNWPENQGAQILLAGDNFGCGSSREHAPWALTGWGLKAVISTSFADIFRNNSLKNGLLPVILNPQAHARLLELLTADPALSIKVDLAAQRIEAKGFSEEFPIEPFSKQCLLEGMDELDYLLHFESAIVRYEKTHPVFS